MRNCWRCKCVTPQEIVREQKSNGTWAIGYVCELCEGWTGDGECKSYWMRHEHLRSHGIIIESLRVKGELARLQPCIICNEPGELHHWAPQCVERQFEEYNKWPTAYLCQKHHAEWHRIVTPDYELLKSKNPQTQQSLLNGETQ